jgi:glycosyltransferase involved in cell wall biosynthesis
MSSGDKTSDERPLISIIIPVFNEADNIDELFNQLDPVLSSLDQGYRFELIFTDNHSTDDTFEKLSVRAETDSRLRIIRFSRNFGYQRSIFSGYLAAKGAAAIQIDADLQDPPELIPEFLERWHKGYMVVYGVRTTREEGIVIQSIRKFYYRLVNRISEIDLPVDAGDFRLVDRRVLDILGEMDDYAPYLRGMIAGIGFSQIGVPYSRRVRNTGESKFSFYSYIQLALDGIIANSIIPLRIATFAGLAVSLLMVVMLATYIFGWIIFGATWPKGFATTTILIALGIALNVMFLGILGEYIARIYRQSVKRPIVIIEKTVGEDD